MVTIEDLPEVALVEILSFVPRKDLILNCRLVCSRWRDLVDLPVLWKRKCQRMGFYPETSDDTFQDWRTFCFLKCNRNIIKNPCGEEDLNFWRFGWGTWTSSPEIMPTHSIPLERHDFYRPYGQMPRPPQEIQRCFLVTCPQRNRAEHYIKDQLICLQGKGFSDQVMDEIRPIIRVKDWHFPNGHSSCTVIVNLMSEDFKILQECRLENVKYNCWNELSHTFDSYPPGVRTVAVEHSGRAENYVKITGTSVTLDLEETPPEAPFFRREMVHVADLPEDILIEVLVRVPARELVRNCRLVCPLWRDLVDLPSLWKRKCQADGYRPKMSEKSVPDWKTHYFLCSLKRNLVKNPCAEEGFSSWEKESNGGDEWKIEDLPGSHGREFPHPHVRKYFVTSYGSCVKSQLITLKKEGYWDQLMDEVKPDIVVKDWYAARFDCGCRYQLCVRLLSADYIVLQEFLPEDVIIEQWSDAEWKEVSYTFRNYPAGVRHIFFRHGGQDTQFWAGWYGVRVTNTSITLGPEVAG